MKNKKRIVTMIAVLSACVMNGCGATGGQSSATDRNEKITINTDESIQENVTEENEVINSGEKSDQQWNITEGTSEYRGFLMDNVLHSESVGDIHYHIYVPDSYDGNEAYALYITLPGYEGLYFQGVGINLQSEDFAFEARKYNEKMIIAAPQLDDWGETSAKKTVELTQFLIDYYNIDTSRVYASGYSGGGETMSLVLEKAPELFTAYLHCSSRWDGEYAPVTENRIPIYFAVGENDEYYSSAPTREAYEDLHELYEKQGLSGAEMDKLLVLDVKEHEYFTSRGWNNEHGGGGLFAYDEVIMGWLFSQEKE